jgi:hypothetical protein
VAGSTSGALATTVTTLTIIAVTSEEVAELTERRRRGPLQQSTLLGAISSASLPTDTSNRRNTVRERKLRNACSSRSRPPSPARYSATPPDGKRC